MNKLILILGISLSTYTFSQSNCFSNKDDVMTYVIWKTFESKDGNIRLEFSSDQATLRAGSSTYTCMYDRFSYLGYGYKGAVEMTDIYNGERIKMFVSCKERMMTDNSGNVLYLQGTTNSSGNNYDNNYNDSYDNNNSDSKTLLSSGETKRIGKLEFMTKNLSEDKMGWDEAKRACEALGDGWRLPTKEELLLLCEAKDHIGGGGKWGLSGGFWSSTEYYRLDKNDMAYWVDFSGCYANKSLKNGSRNYVRAVRTDSSSVGDLTLLNIVKEEKESQIIDSESKLSDLKFRQNKELKEQERLIQEYKEKLRQEHKRLDKVKDSINVLKGKLLDYGTNENQIGAFKMLALQDLYMIKIEDKKLNKFNDQIKETHSISDQNFELVYSKNEVYVLVEKGKIKIRKISYNEKEKKLFDKIVSKEILIPVGQSRGNFLKEKTGLDKRYFTLKLEFNNQEIIANKQEGKIDSLIQIEKSEASKKIGLERKFKKAIRQEEKIIKNYKERMETVLMTIKNIEDEANKPIKMGNFEVINKMMSVVSFDDAKKACAEKGENWRLPTELEYKIIFQNIDKLTVPMDWGVFWIGSKIEGNEMPIYNQSENGTGSIQKGDQGTNVRFFIVRNL